MSDLSRLLGDVYGAPPEPDAESEAGRGPEPGAAADDRAGRPGALPEWADESVLDEAFSNWVPGPATDAPAAERSLLTELAGDRAAPATAPAPEAEAAARPSSLADAVPSAPDFLFDGDAADAPLEPVVVPGRWVRGDDDLLPTRPRARRRPRRA